MPRLEPIKPPPCAQCSGVCCRAESGFPYACSLEPEDLAHPDIRRQAKHRKRQDVWFLPYRGGKCVFLDGATNRCRIYDHRPQVCREFNCRGCLEFDRFLCLNPTVKAILKAHPNAPPSEP